jgi:hypothetical protein
MLIVMRGEGVRRAGQNRVSVFWAESLPETGTRKDTSDRIKQKGVN